MKDNHVEKTFLYLLALSILFHVAVFGLASLLLSEKPKSAPEPTMVDLTDLPEPPPSPVPRRSAKKANEKPQRVTREIAPKGRQEIERVRQPAARAPQPNQTAALPAHSAGRPAEPAAPSPRALPGPAPQVSEEPIARGEGHFRPKTGAVPGRSTLFPSAGRMAQLEQSYRKKYGPEVEDGETKFLNTDDIQFGSFLRHFETAVYGAWHYPQAAAQRGIEGVTPVKITFNRGGEIVHVALLESSGSQILDDEVLRSLKQLGPIGSFPKGYTGETFRLIAFFQYRVGGGRLL